jgi:WD40 repeat protein
MPNKKLCAGLLICIVMMFAMTLVRDYQPSSLATTSVTDKKEMNLKQAAEYKSNILQDISTDGRWLLFYQTSTPTRSQTIPQGGNRARANQPSTSDDVLRVVERSSGRELGRIKVEFFPESVQFIPGTQQVFYKEPASNKQKYLFKVWNFSKGEAKACSDADVTNFRYATVVDAQHALGTVLEENGGESLGKLTLPECARTIISPVDPEYPQGKVWGGVAVSLDKRFLAYTIYAGSEVIIWDTANKRVAKNLSPAPLSFWDKPAYTPDGKLLIVIAGTNAVGGKNTKSYLLVYDTRTYQQVRRLEVPAVSAFAVSPDSQVLAVGYTKEEKKASITTEQAQLVLYNLMTGKEVGKASHPPVKQQRSDPFAAKITQLAFTPDGRYLLSSTYDTRLWQLGD